MEQDVVADQTRFRQGDMKYHTLHTKCECRLITPATGLYPSEMFEPPPGGASTLLLGLSVMKLPTFWPSGLT